MKKEILNAKKEGDPIEGVSAIGILELIKIIDKRGNGSGVISL